MELSVKSGIWQSYDQMYSKENYHETCYAGPLMAMKPVNWDILFTSLIELLDDWIFQFGDD